MADGLTIGVTFYIHDGYRSIWCNGGHQNAVFLCRLLGRCPEVKRVIPINGGSGDRPHPAMLLDSLGELPRFEQVADDLDVYIECGAQIPPSHAERVHANGGAVVGYRFGNHLLLDSLALLKGEGSKPAYNGTRFDAIWTTPQHMATNASYWKACYRCPVVELPHIWEPLFVERAKAEMAGEGLAFEYQPGRAAKRICIYEPNRDIVKLATIPMVAADLAYRKAPDLIDEVNVLNGHGLAQQRTWQTIACALDINNTPHPTREGNVCQFWGRYILPAFQARHGDVVVTHQWENGLNYVYYELLYGHYPLVHNSELLPAFAGYRYHGFDAHEAAQSLLWVLRHHDEPSNLEGYNDGADRMARRVSAKAEHNVAAHSEALRQLDVTRRAA